MRAASVTIRLTMVAALLVAAGNGWGQSGTSGSPPRVDSDPTAPLVLSHDLASRGTLVLDMNVGEVHVVRNPDQHKIRLEIRPGRFESEAVVRGWVKRFDVAGGRAAVELHLPKHQNHDDGPSITLFVPAETALKLDLGIGQMGISGVRGDKELHVGIGQLTVGLGDATEYAHVDNSVRLGQVSDSVFHEEHGGFFPAEHRTVDQGHYRLTAHVGIGDLALQQEDKQL